MKTFAFIRVNPEAVCTKEKIVIYRIKNNEPIRLETIIRGYRYADQAVIEWLTNNNYIRFPTENEKRSIGDGKYFWHRVDLKLLAKVQIFEM